MPDGDRSGTISLDEFLYGVRVNLLNDNIFFTVNLHLHGSRLYSYVRLLNIIF